MKNQHIPVLMTFITLMITACQQSNTQLSQHLDDNSSSANVTKKNVTKKNVTKNSMQTKAALRKVENVLNTSISEREKYRYCNGYERQQLKKYQQDIFEQQEPQALKWFMAFQFNRNPNCFDMAGALVEILETLGEDRLLLMMGGFSHSDNANLHAYLSLGFDNKNEHYYNNSATNEWIKYPKLQDALRYGLNANIKMTTTEQGRQLADKTRDINKDSYEFATLTYKDYALKRCLSMNYNKEVGKQGLLKDISNVKNSYAFSADVTLEFYQFVHQYTEHYYQDQLNKHYEEGGDRHMNMIFSHCIDFYHSDELANFLKKNGLK